MLRDKLLFYLKRIINYEKYHDSRVVYGVYPYACLLRLRL